MTSPARQNEAVQFFQWLRSGRGYPKAWPIHAGLFRDGEIRNGERLRVFRTRHPLSGGSAVSIHVGYPSTTRQGIQFGLLVAADAEKSYWKDLVSEKKACLSSKHEIPSADSAMASSTEKVVGGHSDLTLERWLNCRRLLDDRS